MNKDGSVSELALGGPTGVKQCIVQRADDEEQAGPQESAPSLAQTPARSPSSAPSHNTYSLSFRIKK